jgi:uncharacterized protein (DUF1499 family)
MEDSVSRNFRQALTIDPAYHRMQKLANITKVTPIIICYPKTVIVSKMKMCMKERIRGRKYETKMKQ